MPAGFVGSFMWSPHLRRVLEAAAALAALGPAVVTIPIGHPSPAARAPHAPGSALAHGRELQRRAIRRRISDGVTARVRILRPILPLLLAGKFSIWLDGGTHVRRSASLRMRPCAKPPRRAVTACRIAAIDPQSRQNRKNP